MHQATGGSSDDTYVKINDRWRYVYRAIDQHGHVVDGLVPARRDAAAAHRFSTRALRTLKVRPTEVVTDAAPVYPGVLDELIPSGVAPRRAVRQQPDRG
jgi:transposase-like protein